MKKRRVRKLSWSDYKQKPKKVSQALNRWEGLLKGRVAVKTHFGEPGNENALRGNIVKPVLHWMRKKGIKGFLTDTNTLYTGQRSDTPTHVRTAEKHGFAGLGLPIKIAEEDHHQFRLKDLEGGYRRLPIRLGRELREADSIVCLSHVKGHPLFGYGGALKNLGMGGATPAGKRILHANTIGSINKEKCTLCATCIKNCPTGAIQKKSGEMVISPSKCIGCGECVSVCPQNAIQVGEEDLSSCQEKTAVYAYALTKGKPCLYINFVINVSKICDCSSATKPKLIRDLGIIFSEDPVAADQAALDWINETADKDLFLEVNGVDYRPILQKAEQLGLGSRNYSIEKI